MSAVKQPVDHDQYDDAHLSDEERERRIHSDSQSRDRRVIPRLSHPELRKNLRAVSMLCNIGVAFAILYIGGLIARHVHDTNLELNRSIFFGVVIAIIAASFAYLGSALKSYVENESQLRLVIVSERMFKAFFVFVVSGLILGIASIITWF